MNKYKNRNGKGSLLTDNELALYAETIIQISSGFISPVFPLSNNSNPTDLVCLNPIKETNLGRSFISLVQWNEVFVPVIKRVSPLIGRLPASSSPLDFNQTVVGYSAYYRESIGSLYDAYDDSLLDLVKKMIRKTAQEAGYGT